MLDILSRYAKLIPLIGGFLFGVLGAVWSLVVVDRLGSEREQLSNATAELTKQMQSLERIAADYFIANQQGDLIFILSLQGSGRQELASLIYKGNMLDRATPVRNMIGALALAKQLDYRQTYDAYEKLNDEARGNLSFGNFMQLKEAEKTIIEKGQARVGLLLNEVFEIEKAINANEAAQKKNRVIGFIASIIGNFLLLLANLIAKREA
jgi:hypothetical protein